MRIAKILALSLLFITTAIGATAQNGTMTPYSSYGYGILGDHATSAQRAMGGVGYAMNSGRQINVMNPASYAAIDTLTFLFDMGIDLTAMWQNETLSDGKRLSERNFGGGLDYVTMQFPLGRRMGASVGLVPYSSVGYSFGSEIDNGIDSRQGSGSINELYVGVSGNPFKGFYVGANISYMFGNIINDTYAIANAGYSTLYQKQLEVRDYHLNFGAQYGVGFGNGDRLTLGLTYSPAKTLLGNARMVYYDTQQDTKPEVTDEHKLRGNYSLPETWGAGINYNFGRKFMVEFDYTYQPWSKVKFRGFDGESISHNYANRTKYALGMQFTPNFRGGYFKRVQYRMGAYYNNDYLLIRGNQLREYGVTAGFGFPVPTFKTIVNLGFEWKHRQANPNPLIKENYFNVTIGINFNEMWFRQNKLY